MLCTTSLLFTSSMATGKLNDFGKSEGLSAGLAYILDYSAYKGSKNPDDTILPYLAYDWENAHLGVDGFNYHFFNAEFLEITLLVNPRWSFADPDDSEQFKDIKRSIAIEAGLKATINLGGIYMSSEVLKDISDTHDGYEANIEIGVEFDVGILELNLSAGLTYRDNKLSQHLYGVNENEARAGLPAYLAYSTIHPFVQAELFYTINKSAGIFVFASYERLPDAAQDSPLIDTNYDANIGIVVIKQF